jgi:SAM-dependent methyltransferase
MVMSLNYPFLIDQIDRLVGRDGRILDFGCGTGEMIAVARERGYDIVGCDKYDSLWARWRDYASPEAPIHKLDDSGRIPFPDRHFDAVVSNQVFEHIKDLDGPLIEIHRVLKPGGIFINCFPTREIWWEGHIKAPLAHRFFSHPERWRRYLVAMHRLGIGLGRQGKSAQEWAAESSYLPRVCFYRGRKELECSFARWFEILPGAEAEWVRHRLAHHAKLRKIKVPRLFDGILAFLCSRLANRVFVLRALD